jgi:hypothetical protein
MHKRSSRKIPKTSKPRSLYSLGADLIENTASSNLFYCCMHIRCREIQLSHALYRPLSCNWRFILALRCHVTILYSTEWWEDWWICLRGLKSETENFSHNSQCSGWNSNRGPPNYDFKALQVRRHGRCFNEYIRRKYTCSFRQRSGSLI